MGRLKNSAPDEKSIGSLEYFKRELSS